MPGLLLPSLCQWNLRESGKAWQRKASGFQSLLVSLSAGWSWGVPGPRPPRSPTCRENTATLSLKDVDSGRGSWCPGDASPSLSPFYFFPFPSWAVLARLSPFAPFPLTFDPSPSLSSPTSKRGSTAPSLTANRRGALRATAPHRLAPMGSPWIKPAVLGQACSGEGSPHLTSLPVLLERPFLPLERRKAEILKDTTFQRRRFSVTGPACVVWVMLCSCRRGPGFCWDGVRLPCGVWVSC